MKQPPHFARSSTPAKPQPTPSQTTQQAFNPTQQALDQRLRNWRTTEAEKLGMPQFFVLGSNTLRDIVLKCPQSLADLRKVEGITLDKVERFGPAILEICTV